MILKKIKNIQNKIKVEKHISKVFRSYSSKPSNGKSILIYAGIGKMYISYFEVLLYHLLKKEGYQVDYLIYDKNIQANELITKQVIETKGKNKFWNRDVSLAKKFLKNANIDFEFIHADRKKINIIIDEISSLNDVYSYSLDGIDLGDIVKGTMYRYYKSLTFGNDAFEVAKRFLHTTLTNYFEIKERTQKKEYDYILFSHGIYVTWEPVSEFCKKNKIDFISYDRAKTQNTININFNQVAPDWSFDTAWERYKDKPLSVNEKEMVSAYLKDRELQTSDVYAYNFSKRSSNINKLKEELNISKNKKVITIFTNLIWDAANVARDIAFKNAFECVTETIAYYKNNKEVHIVLRTHPAEKVLGTKEQYGDLVRQYFKNNLPKNVTIIEPEMDVNSFSVIDLSDVGVVNTSTVGLEFALLGKPIVLISETHYRNKGFTYDVKSSKDYFSTIDKLLKNSTLRINQVVLAEKYFYIMMFLYQQKVPVEYVNGAFNKYSYSDIEKLSRDKVIMNILNKIKEKNNQDFIEWK